MTAGALQVAAIAAVDRLGLLGDGRTIPWRLPHDLRRFRDRTMGKPMIMGRRTFQSLPGPLDGRLSIVLTRDDRFVAEGGQRAGSIDEALGIAAEYAQSHGQDEVMIIGGAEVYEATVTLWDRLLLTIVEGRFAGSVYFPVDRAGRHRWRLTRSALFAADPKNPHAHQFLELERQGPDDPEASDFNLAAWLHLVGHRR